MCVWCALQRSDACMELLSSSSSSRYVTLSQAAWPQGPHTRVETRGLEGRRALKRIPTHTHDNAHEIVSRTCKHHTRIWSTCHVYSVTSVPAAQPGRVSPPRREISEFLLGAVSNLEAKKSPGIAQLFNHRLRVAQLLNHRLRVSQNWNIFEVASRAVCDTTQECGTRCKSIRTLRGSWRIGCLEGKNGEMRSWIGNILR